MEHGPSVPAAPGPWSPSSGRAPKNWVPRPCRVSTVLSTERDQAWAKCLASAASLSTANSQATQPPAPQQECPGSLEQFHAGWPGPSWRAQPRLPILVLSDKSENISSSPGVLRPSMPTAFWCFPEGLMSTRACRCPSWACPRLMTSVRAPKRPLPEAPPWSVSVGARPPAGCGPRVLLWVDSSEQ